MSKLDANILSSLDIVNTIGFGKTSAMRQLISANRNTVLKKDVFWQERESTYTKAIENLFTLTIESINYHADNALDIEENLENPKDDDKISTSDDDGSIVAYEITNQTSNEGTYQLQTEEREASLFYSIPRIISSTTNHDSLIQTLKSSHKIGNGKITKGKGRRQIDCLYQNDPYLQRHRLMVNARQKNRTMKINNMYTMLSTLIPEHITCEPHITPQSKLGILKRAIAYWKSLSKMLTSEEEKMNTNQW